MTLPATGQITINNINVELGSPGTTQASLGQVSFRQLAGVASGPITMNDFHGKSNVFFATISTDQSNLNLATWAAANGWNGTLAAEITIAPGVYIYSTSTGTPGLTTGSFPNGVTIINNGYIIGKGGAGGAGLFRDSPGNPGLPGGTAFAVSGTSSAIYVTNNGTIGGGGGGGGSGGGGWWSTTAAPTPSGGGGGAAGTGAGGTAFSPATAGSPGTNSSSGSGGIGYRIFQSPTSYAYGGDGGAGGSLGSPGGTGLSGWRRGSPSGPAAFPGGTGGSGGPAVVGDSSITWLTIGTRLGPIS